MSLDAIERLKTEIARGRVVAVVGAGVSIGATNRDSNASWTGLLQSGIQYCLDSNSELDPGWVERIHAEIASGNIDELISAAGKITRTLGAPEGGEFRRWLADTVGSLRASDRSVIQALSELGVQLATTNYDGLLEEVTGLASVTWLDHPMVDPIIRGEGNDVLHLHGYWKEPISVILDEASYERLRCDRHAQNALCGLCTSGTLVFIGCGGSLADPSFSRLLRWMRELFSESMHHHFRLYCKEEEGEVRRQHHPDERIRTICYGEDHSELASFLRSLIPVSSNALSVSTHTPETPRLPSCPYYVGREEEVQLLVTTVCSELPASISVLGPPGIGKTTITLAALHDPQVRRRFGERKYFAPCEGALSSESLRAEIAHALHLKPGLEPAAQVFEELERAPALLVLDNLETPWEQDREPTEKFLAQLAAVPHLALIVSLRGGQLPPGPHWRESIVVKHLDPSAAREAFLAVAGLRFQSDSKLDALLKAMDRLPLAIYLLAFQAQAEPDLVALWKRWGKEKTKLLQRSGGGKRDIDLEASLEISINSPRMTNDARRLLALLGQLPEGIAEEDLGALLPEVGEAAAATLRQVGLTILPDPRSRMYTPIREYTHSNCRPQEDDLNRVVDYFLDLIQNEEEAKRRD